MVVRKLMMWLLVAVVVIVVAAFVAVQAGFLSGKLPTDLGVKDGRLKPPSRTENSVSSQASLYADHPMKAYAEIAPIKFTGEGKAAIDRIKRIVEEIGIKLPRADVFGKREPSAARPMVVNSRKVDLLSRRLFGRRCAQPIAGAPSPQAAAARCGWSV